MTQNEIINLISELPRIHIPPYMGGNLTKYPTHGGLIAGILARLYRICKNWEYYFSLIFSMQRNDLRIIKSHLKPKRPTIRFNGRALQVKTEHQVRPGGGEARLCRQSNINQPARVLHRTLVVTFVKAKLPIKPNEPGYARRWGYPDLPCSGSGVGIHLSGSGQPGERAAPRIAAGRAP